MQLNFPFLMHCVIIIMRANVRSRIVKSYLATSTVNQQPSLPLRAHCRTDEKEFEMAASERRSVCFKSISWLGGRALLG
jgi:hypothetical protein